MLWRLLVVFVISGVTLGLAYPWLKIWLVSWLAQNTQVQGDLDSLELTNDEKPLENSLLMWISRGIMPYFRLSDVKRPTFTSAHNSCCRMAA
ncbi:Inner membrane protein YjgN [Salmonella enterica subsp. enterica]|uniref:Inner membrane protein YjgN n=1 Tax=Salmonella enterica I TaxID=59201 RepID=A0A3S4GPR3_SALET|nr:Inner membrane protein YjgN [Salmonella enterica subsp. enterica]